MIIDPHVHCRDGKQAYKATIENVFRVADTQGIGKIFDMPNTDPPILTPYDVEARLRLVPPSRRDDYFLWVGATADPDQLRRAVFSYDNYSEVIGLKLFTGKFVGDLAVSEEESQRYIYRTLADLGFEGVLAVHCENENYKKTPMFRPDMPITHAFARPEIVEITSIKDQISFAKEASFKGTLHIAHISTPRSVDLMVEARHHINITCGVTPHHLLWDESMLGRPDGLLYKTNPPLRHKYLVEGLRKKLLSKEIDWVESDHAPHAIGEKLFPPYLSGFPSMHLYNTLTKEFLPSLGLDEAMIEDLTYNNIKRVFNNKL